MIYNGNLLKFIYSITNSELYSECIDINHADQLSEAENGKARKQFSIVDCEYVANVWDTRFGWECMSKSKPQRQRFHFRRSPSH